MQLKEITPSLINGRQTKDIPCVTINIQHGSFAINPKAVEMMELKAGDFVKVFQDQDDDLNWYLCKSENNGFKCGTKKGMQNRLYFTDKNLMKRIAISVESRANCIRALVGGQPTVFDGKNYWGLLILRDV